MKKILNFIVNVDRENRIAQIKLSEQEVTLTYQDEDEWNSFEFNEQVFDIHFFEEDNVFSVSIYDVIDGNVQTSYWHKVKLIIKPTEDNFTELFNPQQNHLDNNAGWSGTCYETFGEELEYVLSFANDFNKQKRVWTLLEVDGVFYISAGYHLINRFGYFITEKPWETGLEEIKIEGCEEEEEI